MPIWPGMLPPRLIANSYKELEFRGTRLFYV